MDSDAGMNPIKRFFGYFFAEKMLGPIFESGLKNIDSVAALIPVTTDITYTIETTTTTAMPCLTILDSAKTPTSAPNTWKCLWRLVPTWVKIN